MRAVDFVIGVGWIVFWVGWLLAAARAKSGRAMWGRNVGIRVAIALAVILLVRVPALRGHGASDQWAGGIGLTLFALGLALAVWARVHLGRNWGTPMSRKDNPELVTSGPYRWIRNPIYSGLILAMLGTAIAVTYIWFGVVAVVGGFFVYSAVVEQRDMTAQFPDAYPAYRSSTRMLVPFIF